MSSRCSAVRLKRVYDPPAPGDGFRLLVDRLWPRGLTKQAARVDLWLKEVAPTTELRRWYHKDLARWPAFAARYKIELAGNPALEELRAVVRGHPTRREGGVALLYGSMDERQNHAKVLVVLLDRRASGTHRGRVAAQSVVVVPAPRASKRVGVWLQ